MKTLRSASLACALALICSGTASAEIVAPGIQSGMLALGQNGAPNVAYVHGTKVIVASRISKGNWRRAAAASVSLGSQLMAFKVGSAGPVVLVRSADERTLVLAHKLGTRWQTIRLAGALPSATRLGWPGVALDGHGPPSLPTHGGTASTTTANSYSCRSTLEADSARRRSPRKASLRAMSPHRPSP